MLQYDDDGMMMGVSRKLRRGDSVGLRDSNKGGIMDVLEWQGYYVHPVGGHVVFAMSKVVKMGRVVE